MAVQQSSWPLSCYSLAIPTGKPPRRASPTRQAAAVQPLQPAHVHDVARIAQRLRDLVRGVGVQARGDLISVQHLRRRRAGAQVGAQGGRRVSGVVAVWIRQKAGQACRGRADWEQRRAGSRGREAHRSSAQRQRLRGGCGVCTTPLTLAWPTSASPLVTRFFCLQGAAAGRGGEQGLSEPAVSHVEPPSQCSTPLCTPPGHQHWGKGTTAAVRRLRLKHATTSPAQHGTAQHGTAQHQHKAHPPEMPRSIWLPTTVSAHTSSPSMCSISSTARLCRPPNACGGGAARGA